MKTVYIILFALSSMICYALTSSSKPNGLNDDIKSRSMARTPDLTNQNQSISSPKTTVNVQSQLVDSCRRFIGTPHQFGGLSKSGVDCSGLLYVNFKALGIEIPRNSSKQSEFFTSVVLSDVQVGDVLFFGSTANDISHTGVVTTLDEENSITFIHTSTSKGVIEEKLRGKYWKSTLRSIGRPNYNDAKING